jgi:hypothetical protein
LNKKKAKFSKKNVMTIELGNDRNKLANWIFDNIGNRVQELRAEPYNKVEAIASKYSGGTLDVTANELLTIIAAHSMTSKGCWVDCKHYKYEHPQNIK